MDPVNAYTAAFAVGLFGGAHCLGMCGGIMAALSFAVPAEEKTKRLGILLGYNLGRIGSYTLLGLLVGLLGQQLSGGSGMTAMRFAAGGLLIAMGLYLADWWRGLTHLERLGGGLWKFVQPLSKKLMPVKNPISAVALGAVWGWLPCGLIYTALVYAMAQGNAIESAGVMLAFGLGTLPTVFAGGWFADQLKQLLQAKGLRIVMALLLVGFGIWTIWIAASHAGHGDHSAHGAMSSDTMSNGHENHQMHSSNSDNVSQPEHKADDEPHATHHKHHH